MWLAEWAKMSLDWQELPGDYVNLTTQRKYTVDEARSLLNGLLLDRGYTMLREGEVLRVVSIKTLDPSMVPRVQPEQLAELDPNEFVKVSFALDWLMAEQAAEEVKSMLSPNHKLTAMKSTNRLEITDAVGNLRDVYRLIEEEQSVNDGQLPLHEFTFTYARASDAAEILRGLLGLEAPPAAQSAAMSPQQMQQQMQMMQQMQQQQQQQQAQQGGAAPVAGAKVNLVVNSRRNSILVSAPPDKMVIVREAVILIDVPRDNTEALQGLVNRVNTYRLASLDPEALVSTLQEVGNLDPTTRLQVDKTNKAVVVYGSLADHVTVRMLVSKLDGSGRRFDVIKLRRLEADYVAGTIRFMMGGEEEEESASSRYRSIYYYSPYGMGNDSSDSKSDEFRVDADVENNRLLLYANDIEMDEIRNLLVKLGEIRSPDDPGGTIRTVDVAPSEADALLNRLRQAWPSLGPNPLVIEPQASPGQPSGERTEPDSPEAEPDAGERATTTGVTPGNAPASASAAPNAAGATDLQAENVPRRPLFRLAQLSQTDEVSGESPATAPQFEQPTAPAATPPTERQAEPPPISISRGADGRLIISSEDTQALDQLEQLMTQLAPPRRDWTVFHLEYAPAYWVAMNLEDFFEEEEDNSLASAFWYGYPQEESDDRRTLSKRRPLKFITDTDTNTIVAIGADPAQLRTIEELIELYDQPEPSTSQSSRVSSVYQVRFSKASTIAEAVKDVYRDLLSSNDKALAQQQQQGQNGEQRPTRSTTYILGGTDERQEKTQVTFKGKLSLGVDDLSNTLVISTEGESLMEIITQMVRSLDEAARPTSTVQVVRTRNGLNPAHLHQVLAQMFDPSAARGNEQQGEQRPGEQQEGAEGDPRRRGSQQQQQNGGQPQSNGETAAVASPDD